MQAQIGIRDTGINVFEVLRMISNGQTYKQILNTYPKLTVADIMASAKLAVDIFEKYVTSEDDIQVDHSIELRVTGRKLVDVSKIREQHPRAYAAWSEKEQQHLVDMFKSGVKPLSIAQSLKRQPGAILSRLKQLGLLKN